MPSPAQVLHSGLPPAPLNGPEHPARGEKTFAILTFAAASMTALLALLPAVGHDQMWCLYVAQRLLDGTTLYGPHLLESNPPLIMWMLLVPTGVARILHLPQSIVFRLFVLAIEAAISFISLRLLRHFQPQPAKSRLCALAFAFVCVFGVIPARDFGQRDHLLVLLFLPYVLAAALHADSSPRTAVASLDAARYRHHCRHRRQLLLKPHHLLVPVAIEAALFLKRRRITLRPEPLALLATCAAYLAAIRLLTPAYLFTVLPILRDTYWAIGHLTLWQLLAEAIQLHILAAAAIALAAITGWHKLPPLNLFLLAAGIAATIAYYLQGTGWYYQQIPALSFFCFALCLELLDLAERHQLKMPSWAPTAAAALSVLAVTLTAYFSGYTLAQPFSFPSGLSDVPDPAFFRGLPAGTAPSPSSAQSSTTPSRPSSRHQLLWAQPREQSLDPPRHPS